jgi:GTP pyrophosphokinase
MHNLAEDGISAHWKYKETDPQHIIREDTRLQWLREMVELYKEQKSSREFLDILKKDLVPEEIYVFTPKGRVVTLPLGASALDFAFKIHTEIGYRSAKAKINGKLAPLKTILKTGDIVEIATSSEVTAKRTWLNIAFTSSARHHIKRWLNLQDKIKNITLGKKLWEKEIHKYSPVPTQFFEEKNLIKNLSKATGYRIQELEDFFTLLGSGKIILNKKLMEHLLSPERMKMRKDALVEKIMTKVVKKPKSGVVVKGEEGSLVNLAKCCSPIKGEPIIGYITSGKGVSIHSLRCPLVKKEILNSQRIIEASWGDSLGESYKGRLLIRSEDSPGVLAKIASAIAELKGNITKADVVTFVDKKAQLKLSLIIRDLKHLESIIKKISGIKEIFSVERI